MPQFDFSKIRDVKVETVIIGFVSVFLVAAIVWAYFASLDQVSRAPGKVIPAGRIQVLQSNDGGVISDILVEEGEVVQEGQVLVRLEQIRIRASVDEARGKVASLKSSMARINAELFDRPLQFSEDVKAYPDFVANQTMLYEKRRKALRDQIKSLENMLGLMQQELQMNMPLLETGDVSKADILRLRRSVSDLQSQIVNANNKYIQDLQTEYTKTEEDLVAARELLAQRSDALADTEIKAPVDGLVRNIILTTIGGVLRPGDEVLSIVPTGGQLIVEAQVSPTDIAYVNVGQRASINFDAYDPSIFGSAGGEVIYVSPDTLVEQKGGTELTYYRVRISVDLSKMKPKNVGKPIVLQPGMTASVEIITGDNTVMRYLTKPITKTFSKAMKER
jgi:adhesin transport system membrane fusion protein